MPLELSNSRLGKSLDFGEGGFTGSLSTWHELLQMTAPDPQCGVVFVRGDFPDHPESILARAQRRNQKGTFGLGIGIPDDADWVQESTAAQGMINLRWPFTRLNWTRADKRFGSVRFASYTACSFVKDGTLYQIGRILPARLSSSVSASEHQFDEKKTQTTFDIDVGGIIRFGCPSSAASRRDNDIGQTPIPAPFYDNYTVYPPESDQAAYAIACTSTVHQKRLEIRLWLNREPVLLSRHECESPRLRDEPHAEEFPHQVGRLHVRHEATFCEERPMVMVAAFSLVDSSSTFNAERCDVIEYGDVQNYLGVSDASVQASYRLFNTLINPPSNTEAFEVEAIGRAVESILGVASVPVPGTSATVCNGLEASSTGDGSDTTPVGGSCSEGGPLPDDCSEILLDDGCSGQTGNAADTPCIALLKNIVMPQVVDLESTLYVTPASISALILLVLLTLRRSWQVRLLVKAAILLNSGSETIARVEQQEPKRRNREEMQAQHRERIIRTLRGVCRWVLNITHPLQTPEPSRCLQDPQIGILASDVLSGPSPAAKRKCKPRLCPPEHMCNRAHCRHEPTGLKGETRKNQKYYCAPIIWYVLKQLPEVFEGGCCRAALWDSVGVLSAISSRENIGVLALDDPTGCLVRWYHSFSLARICQFLGQEDGRRVEDLIGNIEEVEENSKQWQVKAEKAMRLYGQGRLNVLNYEAANLATLGPELGVKKSSITRGGKGKSCYEAAQHEIRHRNPTEHVSPGRARVLRWDANDNHNIRSAAPRPAPWEVNCLAQFAPINLGVEDNREACLEACKEFMTTDYTFMSSWDYSRAMTVGKWWDFSTSSIICARLLADADAAAAADANDTRGTSRHADLKPLPKVPSQAQLAFDQLCKLPAEELTSKDVPASEIEILMKIYAIHRQAQARSQCRFDWKMRKPMVLYHSDSNVQSLEDTPGVYKVKQTSNVMLRSNIKKYTEANILPEKSWSLATVSKRIGASKLHHLSCFDFGLTADMNDTPEISKPLVHGRAHVDFWERWKRENEKENGELLEKFKKDPGLMDLYFVGEHKSYPDFDKCSEQVRNLLGNDEKRDAVLESYQQDLFSVLNDSVGLVMGFGCARLR
jgi:hypothetical protein